MDHLPITDEQLSAFCRRHHIREMALFGSVLRSDFGRQSDIDVLIEFDPNAKIGLLAYAAVQRELSELLRRPVDLVTRRGLKPLIAQEILDSAQVVYAA